MCTLLSVAFGGSRDSWWGECSALCSPVRQTAPPSPHPGQTTPQHSFIQTAIKQATPHAPVCQLPQWVGPLKDLSFTFSFQETDRYPDRPMAIFTSRTFCEPSPSALALVCFRCKAQSSVWIMRNLIHTQTCVQCSDTHVHTQAHTVHFQA